MTTSHFTSVLKGVDILSATRGIIVHGCNATDLPAGGLARLIFEKYPYAEKAHHATINNYSLIQRRDALGQISILEQTDDLHIVNAITQRLPGQGTLSYVAIQKCMVRINEYANQLRDNGIILPILFPKIGAGIAGGDWDKISYIIDQTIDKHHTTILFTV